MNVRIVTGIALIILSSSAHAQTTVNKSLPVKPGQNIEMHFDFPKLIRVSTWDKNEISITGSVSINGGESDDAFKLQTSTSGNTISIRNEIENLKNLPHRYTIVDGSQKIVFKTKDELRKYQAEHGKSKFNMMSSGVDMEILLEIKVPRNMDTRVESIYGMVEINNFTGPLIVQATYGGVDAALTENSTGQVIAETNYGEIYTNLNAKFGGDKLTNKDFHTFVKATPGTGPNYSFESKYGNVYLRKAN